MKEWPELAYVVTHCPFPASPKLMKPVESSASSSSPAPWNAYDIEPEQS